MKKEKIVFIISLIIMTLSSMVSAFAVSAYLYNSNEISYNNSQSGIQSTDVEGAINELYGHATDYTEIKKYFINNPTIDFNGSWLNFYVNGKNRMALGVSGSSGTSTISAKNANGENGKGTLDLRGNPVQINGTNFENMLVVQEYTNDNVTIPAKDVVVNTRNITKSGYTPLLLTCTINNATNNGTLYSWTNVYSYSFTSTTAEAQIRNTFDGQAKIKITYKVLYIKNTQ